MSEFAPSAASVIFLPRSFFCCTVRFCPRYKVTRQLESLGSWEQAMQFQIFVLANK